MKVLLCHNYYQQRGGEYQVFLDEAELLESHGHEVVRYTRHNDEIPGISRLKLAQKTIWNRETYRQLRELIGKEQPRLMHCTNTFPLVSPAAYDAARDEGIAVIQSLHNYRLLCPQAQFLRNGQVCERCLGKTIAWPAVQHACYRNNRGASAVIAAMNAYHRSRGTWTKSVDVYITLTEFARDKFVEGGLPAERILVKANCVLPEPLPGKGSGDYAVFVGRLSPEKGLETLLAAWKRLSSRLKLWVVGDGPLAGRVQQASLVDQRITPMGRRSLEETLQIIGEARFLVMPSIWYETFGRTLIEAYAKATPVVASRLGAMQELVEDGVTGRLFTPGDDRELCKVTESLLDSPERLIKMRRAARLEYEKKYTPSTNYERLREIYNVAASFSSKTD